MTIKSFESQYKDKVWIGSGGFGKVYKAFDPARNHYVALKISDVRPELGQFTLMREVELVNDLAPHPNIARYEGCYRFDIGVAGEIDIAILKFYEDGNLEQFLQKNNLSPEDQKIIIRGILKGVSFLHMNNKIHRDLKPQNILLQREDGIWCPKITDFGLSRNIGSDSSVSNSSIGLSYAYAAPEQIQNKRISKNVDLWAVGAIIYRIVAGEPPFKINSDEKSTQGQMELTLKIVKQELPARLSSLPEPYLSIIRRCLVADNNARVQTAEELIDMLDGRKSDSASVSNIPATGASTPGMEEHTVVLPAPNAIPDTVPVSPPVQDFPPAPGGGLPPYEPPSFQPPPPFNPPPVSPPPMPDPPSYGMPQNQTQVLITPKEPTPPPVAAPTGPRTGEPRKSFAWVWISLLVLLAVITAAIILWPDASDEKSPAMVNKRRTVERIPTAEDFRRNTEAARGDIQELDRISDLIQWQISHSRISDYRRHYELARNRAYANKEAEALQALRQAAIMAIKNRNSSDMMSKIKADMNGAFYDLRQNQRGMVDTILAALEKRDSKTLE